MHASLFFLSLAVSVFILIEKSGKSDNVQSAAVLKPPHIVVERGYVDQERGCWHNTTVTNFKECFVACAKMESCMLAYFPNVCTLCEEGVFLPNNESPRLIGMKNIKNKISDFCPNTPTSFNYTAAKSKGTSTEIFTTPEATRTTSPCPEGYKMFQRRNDKICLGVEYDSNAFTKAKGVLMCSKVGGFISGPDSSDERDYLRDNVMKRMETSITAYAGVGIWIDGSKKKDCVGLPTGCKTTSSFDYADKTMQNLGGYLFYKGQPDGLLGLQDCLQMMVIKNDQNGLIDDQGCVSLYGYGVRSSAVACAKIIS
ncbi:unnamed protein product [Caenorhabditis nigoni]